MKADLSVPLLLLSSRFGPTMTLAQLRDVYFPSVTIKTMQNKATAGLLPRRLGDVYDVRDVADWWEGKKSAANASERTVRTRRRVISV